MVSLDSCWPWHDNSHVKSTFNLLYTSSSFPNQSKIETHHALPTLDPFRDLWWDLHVHRTSLRPVVAGLKMNARTSTVDACSFAIHALICTSVWQLKTALKPLNNDMIKKNTSSLEGTLMCLHKHMCPRTNLKTKVIGVTLMEFSSKWLCSQSQVMPGWCSQSQERPVSSALAQRWARSGMATRDPRAKSYAAMHSSFRRCVGIMRFYINISSEGKVKLMVIVWCS